jgi:PPK2 family polyphosphate:nucleotide phosphotransferase
MLAIAERGKIRHSERGLPDSAPLMPLHPDTLRVPPGAPEPFRHHHPADTLGYNDKAEAQILLAELLVKLRALHDRLYAESRWSLLIILQAMDAAGKDGIVKHVLSGFNQQSCHVTAFRPPAGAELSHSFLWRCQLPLPARGEIGAYNRSYYEEVLVPRVHPEYLPPQRLPTACLAGDNTTPAALKKSAAEPRSPKSHPPAPPAAFWQARFADINAFERHLVRNGTRVLKFFLNLSREEQKRRFLARIADPVRNWKFQPNDARDRRNWRRYQQAYADVLSATSTAWAPWHIVPADFKYVARVAVAEILHHELRALNPQFPRLDQRGKAGLVRAKKALEREK